MTKSKLDSAISKARGETAVTNQPDTAKALTADDILQEASMEDFAEAIQNGGIQAPFFLSMKEKQQIRGFYVGRSEGVLEEIVNGQIVLKKVWRLQFEYAVKKYTDDGKLYHAPTGVRFSMLEVTQLAQGISDLYPADGSVCFLIQKGAEQETNKKRTMHTYSTTAFQNARAPLYQLAAPVAGE